MSLKSITTPQESLFSQTFFMRLKFVSCFKGMKTIQTIKPPTCFDVIPLNNADNIFTAR